MATYRVVESFDPVTTMFDAVIVDESSQCDLFGLAALGIHRACKTKQNVRSWPRAQEPALPHGASVPWGIRPMGYADDRTA